MARENQPAGDVYPTQIGINSHRKGLDACNCFVKKRDYTIYAAKTKVLISCAVTVSLILHMQKERFNQRVKQEVGNYANMTLFLQSTEPPQPCTIVWCGNTD